MENRLPTEAPAAAGPLVPVAYRLVTARRETSDVVTLELAHPRRKRFRFSAGQFNMLYVFGVGEAPISISGDPQETATIFHTIRAVGPVTNALAAARRGDVIGVRGPFGAPWPVDAADGGDLVIVAGGIGLAPLRPLLHHALNHRERFGRVVLLYGARTPGDLLYARELERYRTRPDLMIETTVDRSAAGIWRGSVGPVTKLIPRAGFDPSRATAFVCGPELMIRFTVQALLAQDVAPARIHVSLERNMKCAVGLCGHCQVGPHFVCKDGPVFPWPAVARSLEIREA